MKLSLCKILMHPTHQSLVASNKFNNNSGFLLIMVILLNVNIVESTQLTTKDFNRSGEKFIEFNRQIITRCVERMQMQLKFMYLK